jgi:hypothetical protein
MGHGGYSSSSRSFRSSNKAVANISADDLDKVKSQLVGSYTVNPDGTLMVTMNNAAEIESVKGLVADGFATFLSSVDDRFVGYGHRRPDEVFSQRQINNAMNPHGIVIRESRDSEEHPESLAIILGLDETGSMGSVPHYLVKDGLPHIMDRIIKGGIPHPQVLFLGIGDHECDSAPLQVGQFESSDELLDKWLTDIYLEGRGGGNAGESYLLAWYFAAQHTAIDCFEKRGKKGYCITIGDEPVLDRVPASFLKHMMGDGQFQDYTALELISKASEKYHVFHINVRETQSGNRNHVMDGWRQLLSDNFKIANRKEDVSKIIADIILSGEGAATTFSPEKPAAQATPAVEDMIL